MRYFPILFLLPPITFAALSGTVSNLVPIPGETVIVKFRGENLQPTSATFDNTLVPFFEYQKGAMAVFGISASKPAGKYLFRANFSNGEFFEKTITVKSKIFPKLVLGIPKEVDLSPEGLVKKLETEKVNINTITSQRTAQILWSGNFGLPLYDNRKVTSVYGEIRKTGNTEIRHLGVDFGGKLGAVVAAVNGGRVAKAYYDQVYGNSVILDHGQGIYSLYFHLNEIKIKKGENIKKGQVIGTLGKTGYSTSPHLHFSLKVGNVSVDPINFVSVFK